MNFGIFLGRLIRAPLDRPVPLPLVSNGPLGDCSYANRDDTPLAVSLQRVLLRGSQSASREARN